MAPAPSTPNLFELRSRTVHVTYATSGIDGKPHLTYQDPHQTLNFRGDEIRSADTELGTLVSVSIRRTIDAGGTTFSFVVPRINLDSTNTAQVSTNGITTVHRFSIIPFANTGQLDSYAVTPLRGTARFVVF